MICRLFYFTWENNNNFSEKGITNMETARRHPHKHEESWRGGGGGAGGYFEACLFSLGPTEAELPRSAWSCNWWHFRSKRWEENHFCQRHRSFPSRLISAGVSELWLFCFLSILFPRLFSLPLFVLLNRGSIVVQVFIVKFFVPLWISLLLNKRTWIRL